MPIRFDCPSCGRSLQVSESSAGEHVTCPNCRNSLTVPEDVVDAETFGDTSAPSPSDSSRSSEREENDRREIIGHASNDRRPCPMCGEMIPVKAAKCRFCGEIFDPELRRMEEKKKIPSSDADMGTGEWVLVILPCSWIGCIFGIVWMLQGKPKGPKMFGLSLLSTFIWSCIQVAIKEAANR